MQPRRDRSKFEGIEVARGLAAVLVVFHHAGNNVAEARFFGVHPLGGHLQNFNVGVDFFFVLSGFIIAWIHASDIGLRNRLKPFAIRRFLRIYPPYWGVLIPLAVMYFLAPSAGQPHQHDLTTFFFSLALLPYPNPPVLGVAWTLVHEVMFYSLFGLIIFLGRRSLCLLILWGVLIIGAQPWEPLRFPFSIILSAFNIEFLLGVGVAFWLKRGVVPAPIFLLLISMGSFFALMLFALNIQDISIVGRVSFGLSAAVAIASLVELERSKGLTLPAAAVFLGSASYAIYLIHGVAMSFASQVAVRIFPKTIWPEIPLLFLTVIGVLAGSIYHLWFELKLFASLRNVFSAWYGSRSSAS